MDVKLTVIVEVPDGTDTEQVRDNVRDALDDACDTGAMSLGGVDYVSLVSVKVAE